ncbi:MAG: hypothetical protein ABL894_03440 [Hyphomicrobium sp.]
MSDFEVLAFAKGEHRLFAGLAAVLLSAAVSANPARAAEYCVTCAGPAAMYACSIEGAAPDSPSDPRMQLVCIQELARQGGHETCSVPRSAPQPCPGVMRIVSVPQGLPAVAGAPDAEGPAGAGGVAPPSAEAAAPSEAAPALEGETVKAKAKEPRTVEELAAQTVEASKKGLKKAGDAVTGTAEKAGESVEKAGGAVGSAAKKTWHCLTSFFSDC